MKRSLMGLAAASALLAGCATGDSVVIYNKYQAADYNYAAVQYYNADRPSFVEIHNNPFGAGEADNQIATLMRSANTGRPILFTADRNYAGQDTKVVVVFAPPKSMTGLAACNLDGAQSGAAPGTQGEVLMSYCINGQDKSSLRASAGSVKNLDDPALQRLLSRATHDLLPEVFTKRHGGGVG